MEKLANEIADILVESVKLQFSLQGHPLTGKFEKTIEHKIRLTAQGANIQVLMQNYGIILNKGVARSRVPYNPNKRTGAKRSKYIEGLKGYAQKRFGANPKKALSIAFAIAKKHAREGIPSISSKKFSKTGKRTEFLEDAIKESEVQINKIIEDSLELIIKTEIELL